MKEMNIQFHKTRPQNPFDDGAKARLHRMGLLRIDGSVDEATLNALSRAYSGNHISGKRQRNKCHKETSHSHLIVIIVMRKLD